MRRREKSDHSYCRKNIFRAVSNCCCFSTRKSRFCFACRIFEIERNYCTWKIATVSYFSSFFGFFRVDFREIEMFFDRKIRIRAFFAWFWAGFLDFKRFKFRFEKKKVFLWFLIGDQILELNFYALSFNFKPRLLEELVAFQSGRNSGRRTFEADICEMECQAGEIFAIFRQMKQFQISPEFLNFRRK